MAGTVLISNALVVNENKIEQKDILIEDKKIAHIGSSIGIKYNEV